MLWQDCLLETGAISGIKGKPKLLLKAMIGQCQTYENMLAYQPLDIQRQCYQAEP